jgi:hypothetical protein
MGAAATLRVGWDRRKSKGSHDDAGKDPLHGWFLQKTNPSARANVASCGTEAHFPNVQSLHALQRTTARVNAG